MAHVITPKNDVSKIVTQAPKQFRIADIESGLGQLWAQLNQANSDGHTVVMSACMSNLIIFCDSSQEAESISQEIAVIVDVHPARILLLMGNGNPSEKALLRHISQFITQRSMTVGRYVQKG